ncbi:neuroguidin [Grus japonensis]|uniref:Neuroguidin n=1 Tax=Grus japonensis TaxID=30415 RepID=A0ABC9XWY1_GRUJA
MAEAVALLEALRGQVAAVTDHGLALLRRVGGGRLRTEKGVSLLEVRAQALLQYLQDLALLLAAKTRGGTLGALPALPRLLETRLVLEKLRPAERRLKYQLEKLLRAGGRGGGDDDDDPLRFRPAPANMEEEGEEEEEGGGAKAPGLGGGRRYVPPRLVPVQYDAVGQERERRAREAARRRALSGSVIRELREELGDAPHQVGGDEGGASATPRHAQMRRRYEEAMLEAPPPKKKRKKLPLTGRRKRRGFRRRR